MHAKTGLAGSIGGIKLPSVKVTLDGFKRGFLAVRSKGRVLISFIISFNDVGAATEVALAQISRDAGLLFHNADTARHQAA